MNKATRILAVLVLLVTAAFASTQTKQGTTFDAPIVLTTNGPEAATTTQGKPFTETIYGGTLQNDDAYMVAVCEYGFQLDSNDLGRMTDGFATAKGVDGTILSRRGTTVSGLPAEASVIDSKQGNRTLRFFLVTTVKGNKAYLYLFGTWMDTQGTDTDAVKTFFESIAIQ